MSHVDPTSNEVVAAIVMDAVIEGGDLTVGAGFVWLRASSEMVAQIDLATDRVVARIGSPQASGSAHASDGQLWISTHVGERPRVAGRAPPHPAERWVASSSIDDACANVDDRDVLVRSLRELTPAAV